MNDQIVVVLDRSGSMSTIQSDMEGGLNEFIQQQRVVSPHAEFTLVKFDHEYLMELDRYPIEGVKPIRLEPRGMTALHDAIGRTINYLRERMHCPNCGDRAKVVFAVITDGHENASKEYNGSDIKHLINQMKKERDWQFVFLGANQDAIQTGEQYGINSNASITYTANAGGVRGVTQAFSNATSCYLADMSNSVTFNQDDREQAVSNDPVPELKTETTTGA